MQDSIKQITKQHSQFAKYLSLIPSSLLGSVAWAGLFGNLVREIQREVGQDEPQQVIVAALVGGILARVVSELAEDLREETGVSEYITSSTLQAIIASTVIDTAAKLLVDEDLTLPV